jgi:hypothetical protein
VNFFLIIPGSILMRQTEKLQFNQASSQAPPSHFGPSAKLKAYFSDKDPDVLDNFWDYWGRCTSSPLYNLAARFRSSSAVLCNKNDVTVHDENDSIRAAVVFLNSLPPSYWDI